MGNMQKGKFGPLEVLVMRCLLIMIVRSRVKENPTTQGMLISNSRNFLNLTIIICTYRNDKATTYFVLKDVYGKFQMLLAVMENAMFGRLCV